MPWYQVVVHIKGHPQLSESLISYHVKYIPIVFSRVLGAVYKGRPANGEGGGFEISDISGRGEGGVVCESSDVRKFLKKIKIPKFLRAL